MYFYNFVKYIQYFIVKNRFIKLEVVLLVINLILFPLVTSCRERETAWSKSCR